jgi:hypothetical protein
VREPPPFKEVDTRLIFLLVDRIIYGLVGASIEFGISEPHVAQNSTKYLKRSCSAIIKLTLVCCRPKASAERKG